MTETPIIIDTPDGAKIYGLLNSPVKGRNQKVVLHIHGLEGSQSDYAAVRMAMTFPKHGYDVVRINLYYWQEKARSLFDCTIRQHALDIDTVCKHLKKKYDSVFVTGHSYGGPSIMTAKVNAFDAISLWDPTFTPASTISKKDFKKVGKYYIDPTGTHLVVSNAFIEEAKTYDRTKAITLARKCKVPLQIIYADYWSQFGESFHTHSRGPTDERIIKKSAHAFYEEGTTEPLLRYTRQWFDQF